MLKLLKQLIDSNDREVQRAKRVVEQINALEPQMMETSFDDMKKRIAEMRGELGLLVDKIPQESRTSLKSIDKNKGLPEYERAIQEKLLSFLPEVYAMIREVMRRDFDRRHFDVQLLAGVLLAQGQKLVEVKTGEGKTQIFHLPLFLYSLVGRGAHMVTVNEYLARRDGEYAGHVASRLGISVGVITPGNRSYMYIPDTEVQEKKGKEAFEELPVGVKPTIAGMQGLNLLEVSKKDAYNCDVTYGINNEFGFDYLRDNMAWELSQRVQGELYFCVVDEADSILIDEARTPLIISAVPEDTDTDKYFRFANAVKNLEEGKDYTVDYKSKSVMLTEEGIQSSEKALGVDNLWSDYSFAHHLENALKAKALFLKDDQYIIRNGEILIVDSFTGRVLPGRRYSEGLHQAIEAKKV
jgi:preprotein translocase subunit SecA